MSEQYSFLGEFACMYCKENFDPTGTRTLGKGEVADFTCPKCDAVWRFFVSIQLHHKLIKGGKYNTQQ